MSADAAEAAHHRTFEELIILSRGARPEGPRPAQGDAQAGRELQRRHLASGEGITTVRQEGPDATPLKNVWAFSSSRLIKKASYCSERHLFIIVRVLHTLFPLGLICRSGQILRNNLGLTLSTL